MTTHAIGTTLQQPSLVSSYMQRGGSVSFTDICRVNYADLPAGVSGYSVVAFGHVGRFSTTGGTDKFALIGLRFLNGGGIDSRTLTRVPLHTPVYQDTSTGGTRNAAIPWCAVLNLPSGSWPSNTNLAISATVEQVSAPSGSPGSFWVDACAIFVFSHSSLGITYANQTANTTLPYNDVGFATLTGTATMATTGRRIAFYSAQASPPGRAAVPNPLYPHYTWMSRRVSGVDDGTFGTAGFAQVMGCTSRLPAEANTSTPDPLYQLYSLGGWYPVEVPSANVVDVEVRGWTGAAAASAAIRGISAYAGVFLVPEAPFTDLLHEATLVVPDLLNRDPWSQAQARTVAIGDDRPRHFTLGMTMLSDQIVADNKASMTLLDIGGYPQQRFPVNALQTRVIDPAVDRLPNFAAQILSTPPFQAQWPELPVTLRGVLNPFETATDDSGGGYALLSITPTDDADRTPPVQRTITYVPITLDSEIDGTSLLQLTDDEHPSDSRSISRETGVVEFETDDGHVIRWPTWSKSRRAWRVSWTCDQGTYQILYTKLYRPEATLFVRMPPSWPDAPNAVVMVDQLSAEQVGSNLVWRISATLVEAVHTA